MDENLKQQFLDQDGLEELISLIKAADKVIEDKVDSLIWQGTKAEYDAEIAKGEDSKIKEGTVVIITDAEDDIQPVIPAEEIRTLFKTVEPGA